MLRSISQAFVNAGKRRTFSRMGMHNRKIGIQMPWSTNAVFSDSRKQFTQCSLGSFFHNQKSHAKLTQPTICQRLNQRVTSKDHSPNRNFMTLRDIFPIPQSTSLFQPIHRNFSSKTDKKVLYRTLFRALRRYTKHPEVFPPAIVLKELERQGLPTLCLDEESSAAVLKWTFSQKPKNNKGGIIEAFDVIKFVETVHYGRYNENIPEELPVFQYQHPLLPGTPLELHILEPRYLEMVRQIVEGPKMQQGKGHHRFIYIYPGEEHDSIKFDEELESEKASAVDDADDEYDKEFPHDEYEYDEEFDQEDNEEVEDMTGRIGVIMHVENVEHKTDGQINLKTRAGARIRVLSQRTANVGLSKPLTHFTFDVIVDDSECDIALDNASQECQELLEELYDRGGVKFREALESYLGLPPLSSSNPEAFSFWLSSWLFDRKQQHVSLYTTNTLDRLEQCRDVLEIVLKQQAEQQS